MALRFEDLTPKELAVLLETHQRREEREWYRAAWMVSHLLAPYSKKKLKPEEFLGRRPYWQRKKRTADTEG